MILREIGSVGTVERIVSVPRRHAVAILLDHRDHATREIAERVGEIRVVPLLESSPREIAVTVEGGFAEQEIAQRVGAAEIHGLIELYPHTGRLAEPLTLEADE